MIPPLYRAPDFPPEPPVFTSEEDAITTEETPFEVYVYLMAFRSQFNLQEYLGFFKTFLDTYPGFGGLEDNILRWCTTLAIALKRISSPL